MAKLWQWSFWERMKAIKEAKTPIIDNNINPTPTVEIKETKTDDPMKLILEKLERQEAELKALKNQRPQISMKDAREKYAWPRHYAFSLRGGVPVVAWESFRKDSTKDFEFKNIYWQYETNHYMKLKLANGEEVEVTNYNFLRDRQKSDPMPCKVTTDEKWNTTYEFDTESYGKVTVLSTSYIN